jgi:hypothetical protein
LFPVARRRTAALVPIVLCAVAAVVAARLIPTGAGTSAPATQRAVLSEAAGAMAATIVRPVVPAPAPAPVPPPTMTKTTTAAAPPPAPAPTVTPPSAAPVPTPAPAAAPPPAPPPATPSAVPAVGQATAWGCGAALAYLQAYAAPGFSLECPGFAEGREAMTCVRAPGACPTSAVIAIAVPCPQAYMNEASNSLVLTGSSNAPIDPYGPCP